MSLMGWSSESMAARYQHVTDALRSQVASQVGDLIWNPAAGEGSPQLLMVRSDSLGVVLAAAEECLSIHRTGDGESTVILAAIADLRAVLPPAERTRNSE